MRRAFCMGTVAFLLVGAQPARGEEPSVQSLFETVQRLQQRVEKLEVERESESDRVRELEDRIAAAARADASGTRGAAGAGASNLLNPRITAFVDSGADLSTDGDNAARNRFNLREAELDMRAAVSPYADGVVVVAFGEEIEAGDGDTSIDTAVALEEAYLDFHTLFEGFSLKAGKFRSGFGRSNRLHTHDLPQVTRPLAVSAFLGGEGLKAIGASGSWLVPNPWDRWIELTGELVNADAGEESPVLGGSDADHPAALARLSIFEDVGSDASIELGTSFLHGRNEAPYVAGLDATWTWRDPGQPDFRSLLLQGEVFWSNSEFGDAAKRDSQLGAYLFGQVQFAQNWYAGMRYDYSDFPATDAESRGATWGLSPYLTWYASEALRLRLEFQHLQHDLLGSGRSEQVVHLGLTWFIGSHPAHPYWVNK